MLAFQTDISMAQTRNYYNPNDSIIFSGYKWYIKDSQGRYTGPGKNYFSKSADNVHVDEEGKLHLKIVQRNERWFAAEVRLSRSMGFGRYTFVLDKLPQPLDKDAVIGLFIYDEKDTSNHHNEIDIEFSKWGKEKALNSQYVIQPFEDKAMRFNFDLSRPSKHIIEIRKTSICFKSTYLEPVHPDSALEPEREWKFKTSKAYVSGAEKASINYWLYQKTEPASLKDIEVIIKSFSFKPFKLERHRPVIPKIRILKKDKKK
mgnify:CR=1 FL=1